MHLQSSSDRNLHGVRDENRGPSHDQTHFPLLYVTTDYPNPYIGLSGPPMKQIG